MINLTRSDSKNFDFIKLVHQLDDDLAKRDGEEHDFYDQFNKVDQIKHAVVAYKNEIPLGCGAIKLFDTTQAEVKRMFVLPEARGQGIATAIINELEKWAGEMDFDKCILETGIRQPEAISLYEKRGYKVIPNYGQYVGVKNSICFEKQLADI